MKIINNLGYIRTVMGLSQTQLAKKIKIDRRVIADIELHIKIPSIKQVLLLARALK